MKKLKIYKIATTMSTTIFFSVIFCLTSYLGFWAHSNFNKPPIELSYFKARTEGEKVLLTWETKSEQRAAYIAVEFSNDNKYFERLTKIELVSLHRKGRFYRYIDNSPYAGYNYYRLKLVDLDEQFDYSETISVFVEPVREITKTMKKKNIPLLTKP